MNVWYTCFAPNDKIVILKVKVFFCSVSAIITGRVLLKGGDEFWNQGKTFIFYLIVIHQRRNQFIIIIINKHFILFGIV